MGGVTFAKQLYKRLEHTLHSGGDRRLLAKTGVEDLREEIRARHSQAILRTPCQEKNSVGNSTPGHTQVTPPDTLLHSELQRDFLNSPEVNTSWAVRQATLPQA